MFPSFFHIFVEKMVILVHCSIIFPYFSDVFFFPMKLWRFSHGHGGFPQVFAPQGINEGVAQALVRYAA